MNMMGMKHKRTIGEQFTLFSSWMRNISGNNSTSFPIILVSHSEIINVNSMLLDPNKCFLIDTNFVLDERFEKK